MDFAFKRLKEALMLYRVHNAGITAQATMTLDRQREIIRSKNARLFTSSNLRYLEKRSRYSYQVFDPYCNLVQCRDAGADAVLLLVPNLVDAGALLAQSKGQVWLVTTDDSDQQLCSCHAVGDVAQVFYLRDFLEDEQEYQDFIGYLLETRRIDRLLALESQTILGLLLSIGQHYPQVMIEVIQSAKASGIGPSRLLDGQYTQ